jgi:hypothetical protein
MPVFAAKPERPAGVGIRSWRDIAKAGMFAVGVAWDRHFKMLHFAANARSRYGYKPRSKAYMRRKAKRGVPAFLDMVYSGNTRRDVSRVQIPRAFPTRVSIAMATAAYIQMRPDPRHRDAPNLGDELTRVVPDELQALEEVFVDATEPAVAAHLEEATTRNR